MSTQPKIDAPWAQFTVEAHTIDADRGSAIRYRQSPDWGTDLRATAFALAHLIRTVWEHVRELDAQHDPDGLEPLALANMIREVWREDPEVEEGICCQYCGGPDWTHVTDGLRCRHDVAVCSSCGAPWPACEDEVSR